MILSRNEIQEIKTKYGNFKVSKAKNPSVNKEQTILLESTGRQFFVEYHRGTMVVLQRA